jgi:hypothetical protein
MVRGVDTGLNAPTVQCQSSRWLASSLVRLVVGQEILSLSTGVRFPYGVPYEKEV